MLAPLPCITHNPVHHLRPVLMAAVRNIMSVRRAPCARPPSMTHYTAWPQTNMAAGHFSQAGVFSQVLEQAERYAFVMWALSACPDGLRGASEEALVLDLILVFMVMGGILAFAGTPPHHMPPATSSIAALHRLATVGADGCSRRATNFVERLHHSLKTATEPSTLACANRCPHCSVCCRQRAFRARTICQATAPFDSSLCAGCRLGPVCVLRSYRAERRAKVSAGGAHGARAADLPWAGGLPQHGRGGYRGAASRPGFDAGSRDRTVPPEAASPSCPRPGQVTAGMNLGTNINAQSEPGQAVDPQRCCSCLCPKRNGQLKDCAV